MARAAGLTIKAVLHLFICGSQLHLDSLHIVEDDYHGSAFEGNECKKVCKLIIWDLEINNA